MKLRLLFILISFSTILSAQGIEFFHGPWKDALELAKESGKPLFVDSYATWCGPCKRMAKNVFTQDEVGKFYNKNFINLKLDMEKEDGVKFGHKYPVNAYPTLFFLDGNGKVIQKVKGGKTVDALLNLGEIVLKKHDTSGEYEEEYNKGNRDYKLVYDYVKALNKAGKPSLKISNEYLRSQPSITEDEKLRFVVEAAIDSDSKIFGQVIDNKNKIIKLIGEETFKEKVTRATNNTVAKAVEYEVESLLEEAIESYKSALGNDKVAILKMQRAYYLNTGDKPLYLKLSTEQFKKIKKSEKELKGLYGQLHEYKSDKRFHELLGKIAEKLMDMDDSEENVVRYATLLATTGNLEKAEKIVDKKLEELNKKEIQSSQLERIKRHLDKQKA